MDMRVSSDEIRSYVSAQTRIAKQALPEESRRLVLRLPTDSIDFSPASRALQRGRLRVGLEEDGSGQYTKVTDATSNPMMQLLEEGMNTVKKNLDEMKELTELMEGESISPDDRYAAQMRLVELEGELEKNLYALNKQYVEIAKDQNLRVEVNTWEPMEGEADPNAVLDATGKFDSRMSYIADRVTGEVFEFANYTGMIDKRTELKKEALERVRMRELDPEAFKEYEKKLRKTLRLEFQKKANENGHIQDTWGALVLRDPVPRGIEIKEITSPEEGMFTTPTYRVNEFDGSAPNTFTKMEGDVVSSYTVQGLPPYDDLSSADGFVKVPIMPEVDSYEYKMESYIEERLADIERGDYEELNASRVSVMSSELAEESGDFVENLTNQLTEQFKRFAATNELIGSESAEEPMPGQDEKKKTQIADISKSVMNFLKDTILGAIQKNAVREEGDSYNLKIDKSKPSTDDTGDIFAPLAMTPEEFWQMRRPDLFAGGHTGA